MAQQMPPPGTPAQPYPAQPYPASLPPAASTGLLELDVNAAGDEVERGATCIMIDARGWCVSTKTG